MNGRSDKAAGHRHGVGGEASCIPPSTPCRWIPCIIATRRVPRLCRESFRHERLRFRHGRTATARRRGKGHETSLRTPEEAGPRDTAFAAQIGELQNVRPQGIRYAQEVPAEKIHGCIGSAGTIPHRRIVNQWQTRPSGGRMPVFPCADSASTNLS